MHATATLAIWTSCVTLSQTAESHSVQGQRPNIIWIMAEDISTELACYGHPAVKTPNIDKLARDGARYTNAFCTAPSCTPSRNAMMLGVYQTRTDTQDQRRRGVKLPRGMKPITHWLRRGRVLHGARLRLWRKDRPQLHGLRSIRWQ